MADLVYGGASPILADEPGFNFLGLLSPKRRSYLEAEAERTASVVGDMFDLRASELDMLEQMADTADEHKRVNLLRTQFEAAKRMTSSKQFAPLGVQQFGALGEQIRTLGQQLEAGQIEREALAATEAKGRMIDADNYRDQMYKQIDPALALMDKMAQLVAISEVESPIAVRAAAFNLADLLQGGGILTDEDVSGARESLTSWAGTLEQAFETGAGGGLILEARNSLKEILNPLGQTLETAIARSVGRYGAIADARGFNEAERGVMFAGLELDKYQAPRFVPEQAQEPIDAAPDTRSQTRQAAARATERALETAPPLLDTARDVVGGASDAIMDAAGIPQGWLLDSIMDGNEAEYITGKERTLPDGRVVVLTDLGNGRREWRLKGAPKVSGTITR